MESCFEATSTTRGDGLAGSVSQYISRMDRHRRAMGSSLLVGLVILLMRLCKWTMLVEANTALRYLRAWTRFYGRGNRIEGLAYIIFLSSRKYKGGHMRLGPLFGPSRGIRFPIRGPTFAGTRAEGTSGCPMGTRPRPFGWESAWR